MEKEKILFSVNWTKPCRDDVCNSSALLTRSHIYKNRQCNHRNRQSYLMWQNLWPKAARSEKNSKENNFLSSWLAKKICTARLNCVHYFSRIESNWKALHEFKSFSVGVSRIQRKTSCRGKKSVIFYFRDHLHAKFFFVSGSNCPFYCEV